GPHFVYFRIPFDGSPLRLEEKGVSLQFYEKRSSGFQKSAPFPPTACQASSPSGSGVLASQ
ncbi:hypothetical protein, partial [Peribacillus frigoritolerans]|uniref:hypothetical protein n=1 Tax=Peribacillus frigoritolerans TaxID=450367 RepID=UPI00227DA5B1